ncbi:MAG: hypothetical protein A2023_04840 [Sulfuricurvum sp. GWF2_44_89]|uniref:hypothetical protein n=1 Tax=unclassified Sulfuricurvum TaxID=2632390 RepID=UPI0008D1D32C|nr:MULTISPECIES: hypothetical protein [unclassified Sulfuricurvum]OHD78134.1 MAG: hypothetical protein A2023_04840 [Sulfuricurvum sp. GWF2_44_89]OHD91468.1 MAG: hypothetical protein A2517_09690 [Sulfuricurvum sp. RIFOXYD12_FULL_44_77]OHD92599.1 MAG: hypothetical protein A2552_00835 [Sulfuricurvum sp. RIFOXYD2_FULL_44_160]
MKYLVNFANDAFKGKQQQQNETALKIGGFDQIFSFSLNDIDQIFFEENKETLSQPRGSGYWLWKPYFILKVLQTLKEDDYLFYCDSGAYFVDTIDSLITLQKEINQDIIPFHNPHLEKLYTKRDTFLLMECDYPEYTNAMQCLGGIHLWKKTDFTIRFLNEWLDYMKDDRILTDIPNTLGVPNYSEFVSHRHDQSIFSLLCKKYHLISFIDPTQYGNNERLKLNDQQLGQLLHHTKGDKIKRTLLERIIREVSRLFKAKKHY